MLSVASPQVDISRATAVSGWMSEIELTWLATQARKHKYVVEFGSYFGRSARAIADNMMLNGKLWCVDPWDGVYFRKDNEIHPIDTRVMPYFIQNLRDHVDDGRVIPVREFSYRFSLPHKVNMVFIDGDHRYKIVVKDIKKAYDLLVHGGLICGHDYGHSEWPEVREAVTELVVNFEVIDTIWFATKS